VKRGFDFLVSFVMIVLLSPVIAAVAVLIRLNMGGPVLFKQQRPGLGRKTFTIYKFRTMSDACGPDGELLPDEQRLGRLGSWLRKLSIDELPQLLNVLKGEMSLVGPRPLLIKYLPFYTERENTRFTVRPGITGLAQISGRNMLSWNDRLELDAQYVERQSLLFDFKIICLTAWKVIRRENVIVISNLYVKDLDKERGLYG